MSFATDPAWPAFVPGLGAMTFALAALVLVVLTVWTYLGVRAASWRRMFIVLGLRLLALAVTILLILRPSLAVEEEEALQPSRLLILVDTSRSMNTGDEFNNSTRLVNAHRLLASGPVQSALRRLADEKKVEVVLYQGAADLKRYDPTAKATGKSTDMIRWLDGVLGEQGGREANVQALLLLGDGIDTGDTARTLQKAAEYRGRFPIHAFGLGQPIGGAQDKDVALEQIYVDPQPILAKSKFAVKVVVRAPGFENARTDFSLWLENPATRQMTKVKTVPQRFGQAAEQEFTLEADGPDQEGEIKVTVKVEPLPGEASQLNNEISTFAHVSKEGVRILWVEGQRRWEFAIPIRESLRKDRRFQVVEDLRPRGFKPNVRPDDPNALGNKTYDVLVLGDLSAQRFSGGDNAVFEKVRDLVQNQGMGLLMLGGQETFGNSDWYNSPIEKLFPVRLDRRGQVDGPVPVKPTAAGLSYVLKLADEEARNQALWDKVLEPLDGITVPGKLDPLATAFLVHRDSPDVPILASVERGKGRVMTFAGDTTWKVWRRTPEAQAGFDRFWKQMMLWLAHQEFSQGNVFVKLDQRRLDRGRQPNLGFEVGFRGAIVQQPRFTAKIIGPRKEEYPLTVPTALKSTWQPPAPGEYTLVVTGKGTTPAGPALEGTASARFLVFEEDRESLRVAADHDFLDKLATASGGRFARAEERTLLQRLEEIQANRVAAQSRVRHWPDWRRTPAGEGIREQFAALWSSAALACLLIYVSMLCLEWFLRRRWGMV